MGVNLSETPRYSASYLFWAEHGGTPAMPNLRGGGFQSRFLGLYFAA